MPVRGWVMVVGFVAVVTACLPTSTPATTTTSSPTTTSSTTTTTAVAAGASATSRLQTDLDDGHLAVNTAVISDGTLYPPAGATIEFGPNGRLDRTPAETGAAIDISTADVTITGLHIRGSNPCHWTNTNTYNPDSVGERYSQYSFGKDSTGIRWEEHAAVYTRTGALRLTITDATVENVWGDAVTLFGGHDITITELHARCIGRSGISNVDSSDVTVTGGHISGAFWWALNIEPFHDKSVSNYRVSGMTIGYSRLWWLFVGGPHFNCDVSNVDLDVTLTVAAATPRNGERLVPYCVTRQVSIAN